jgi:hypothetical protein
MVDAVSLDFFIGETPTYTLSSMFEIELRFLLTKKPKLKVANLPQFRIALTTVPAHIPHPDNPEIPIQEACTAFELQVPVNHRKVMEEIISKVFDRPEATQLQFMYYKQRHVQPVVFFKAVQMQRKHEQSHRVIAVEGLHPDHHFLFEVTLRKTFPQIIAVLPTSYFTAVQMRQKHKQSHQGLHPDHHFLFELTLQKTFHQIIAVLPTLLTH